MKIFKISQKVNNNYDTYDAFVVYAENEEDAKTVHELDDKKYNYCSWVTETKDIEVEYLGDAKKGAERGEILGSFNAG